LVLALALELVLLLPLFKTILPGGRVVPPLIAFAFALKLGVGLAVRRGAGAGVGAGDPLLKMGGARLMALLVPCKHFDTLVWSM